jgi:hypothetical protein
LQKKILALKRLIAILFCLSLFAEGCMPSANPSQEGRQAMYFSVAAAIDQQAELLALRRAKSLKILQAGNAKPDTLAPQAADWPQELQLFKEADINKPAWAGEYEVRKTAEKITYTAKKNSQPVQLLVISGTPENPDYIEAHLSQANLLYHTGKHLQLHFKDGVLSAYRMEGYQKTFFSDTTRYLLAATVH